ncbi:uncharacterized protein C6orf132 homolog [Notothenia coriiceps]|uniref:Uncharacterized protein C6orf132 homolog n=1 Tax=Notothenia coriiceps TaxID=8208 RepID=A0A6I9N532_9TELE|nr:PREDICTED: uncharacterized protein C6orf132 homolog [Notothenia coriiceps]
MGQTSLKNRVPFVVSLALVFAWSAAEREYFLHPSNRTWEEARNHCQACFKDLVTLTPENVQTVSKLLTSDCWVGLRKNSTSNSTNNGTSNFNSYSTSNSTNNGTNNSTTNNNNTIMDPRMPWFRWANGDPLIFQNWYPGWPVFRSSLPNRYYFVCTEKASLETAAPETVTPETVAPGTGTPDSGTPGTGTPGTGTPGTGTPDSGTPGTGTPDSGTPGTGTPGTGTPGTGTPGTGTPDSGTPGTGTPDSGTPGTGTPDSGTPGTGTPDSITPAMAIQATGNSTGHLRETTFATATAATAASTPSTPARCKITRWPEEAHYVLLPDFPKPDENYIEDSCVAMLSFGPWVERVCSELLSSICYEA